MIIMLWQRTDVCAEKEGSYGWLWHHQGLNLRPSDGGAKCLPELHNLIMNRFLQFISFLYIASI